MFLILCYPGSSLLGSLQLLRSLLVTGWCGIGAIQQDSWIQPHQCQAKVDENNNFVWPAEYAPSSPVCSLLYNELWLNQTWFNQLTTTLRCLYSQAAAQPVSILHQCWSYSATNAETCISSCLILWNFCCPNLQLSDDSSGLKALPFCVSITPPHLTQSANLLTVPSASSYRPLPFCLCYVWKWISRCSFSVTEVTVTSILFPGFSFLPLWKTGVSALSLFPAFMDFCRPLWFFPYDRQQVTLSVSNNSPQALWALNTSSCGCP